MDQDFILCLVIGVMIVVYVLCFYLMALVE